MSGSREKTEGYEKSFASVHRASERNGAVDSHYRSASERCILCAKGEPSN